MKRIFFSQYILINCVGLLSVIGCRDQVLMLDNTEVKGENLKVEAESYITSEGILDLVVTPNKDSVVSTNSRGWLAYDLDVEYAGRYQVIATVF